jgi:hypothetical protein
MHLTKGNRTRGSNLVVGLVLAGAAWMLGALTGVAAAESEAARRTEVAPHWSFQPVTSPIVPEGDPAWIRNPIDAFLSEAHRKRGLVPVTEAAPNVLLRRVYMDLVGVPPTTEELAEFLSEPSDNRYVEVVDRLLASPRHGERWGRHWMDIWRYSDCAARLPLAQRP